MRLGLVIDFVLTEEGISQLIRAVFYLNDSEISIFPQNIDA
tara:strand:+ start:162149 stop:162271 length:123 start_codon:yes stop_codon:yes gene_type:complete